jgi:hypothetical protein
VAGADAQSASSNAEVRPQKCDAPMLCMCDRLKPLLDCWLGLIPQRLSIASAQAAMVR